MSQQSTSTSNIPSTTTLDDLSRLIQNCASKTDIDDIKAHISHYKADTDMQLKKLNTQAMHNTNLALTNADRIDELEASVEMLKQEQLKNNICVSGVPPILLNDTNTNDAIVKIAHALGLTYNATQFSSYAVAQNKFIIVHFYNMKYKLQLLGKIRAKKSLMVEEVFNMQSNSQIYLNDHLTPYFNKLYLIARNAKKEGTLASTTSYGGKIRARKNLSDPPTVIMNERQLMSLIQGEECGDDNNTTLIAEDMQNNRPSTSHHQQANASSSQSPMNKKTNNKQNQPPKDNNTHKQTARKASTQKPTVPRTANKSGSNNNSTRERLPRPGDKRKGINTNEYPNKLRRRNSK